MRLELHDVTLEAEVFGRDQDPPVLLVMGAMASGVWWPEDFCQALAARGRRVIRYDHRDTGASTSFEPGTATYGVEDLARDAIGVLDELGIASAHWVGMSLGGHLAQLAALAKPERVRSLTLIASGPLVASADAPETSSDGGEADELPDWTDRAAVIDYQVEAWRRIAGSAHRFDEPLIRQLAAEDFDRTPNPATALHHASLSPPAAKWIGRFEELPGPVLVIHGTEDRVMPYDVTATLPGTTLVTLPGTGHELHPADWTTMIDAIGRHTEGA
jgi:pimeloyl-ACP methyl ester carboxylesterase